MITETITEKEVELPEFSEVKSLYDLQPAYESDMTNHKCGGSRKLELPGVAAVLPKPIKSRLSSILKDREKNGVTAKNTDDLKQLKNSVKSQLAAIRSLKRFVAHASKNKVKLKDAEATKASLKDWTGRLEDCRNTAMTKLLEETRPQERAMRSFFAFFDVAGCEGAVRTFYYANIDPITTKTTRDRKESSFKELPQSHFVGGYRPLVEAAAQADGETFPVTLVPLKQKLVFQTRTAVVSLGCEFDGLVEAQWWAGIGHNAGALTIGNCSLDHVGEEPWSQEHLAKTDSDLSSENPCMKSLLICGNHPVSREKSAWESEPVTVYPSFVYSGFLLRNELSRPDLCFAVPPINPSRDAIVGKWFIRTICPTLRDRRLDLEELSMALITEMSNKKLNDIVTVFSSSRTAYSKSAHPAELELSTNLARSIVAHWLLMQNGVTESQWEAQRIGRELNLLFKSLASERFDNKPFLSASCDSNQCRLEDQVARNDNGELMVDDATGEPIKTGKKMMVFPLSVQFRKGTENFEVHLVP